MLQIDRRLGGKKRIRIASPHRGGYPMASRMTKELTHAALDRAVRCRRPEPGRIHRSYRGSQYCATSYQRAVVALGMRPSMSRKGKCYDNAPVESFSGTLKEELVYHRRFRTRIEAQAAIQEHIEVFYNRMGRHPAHGDIAPSIFAENYLSDRKAAQSGRVHESLSRVEAVRCPVGVEDNPVPGRW